MGDRLPLLRTKIGFHLQTSCEHAGWKDREIESSSRAEGRGPGVGGEA
jgi:hypothetical protein